jgi:hypothetical protein
MTDPRLDLGPALTGADAADCQHALDRVRPVVRIGRGLDPHAAGAAAALVHLLGRLHPHTTVDGDATLDTNPWSATSVLDAAASVPTPQPTCDPDHDFIIGIGAVDHADLFVGGDEWTAIVSSTPVTAICRSAAFGVHAAAALAAADILKVALAPLGLVHARAVPTTIWNLVDYRLTAAPGVELGATGVPPIALLGAGSIGSSTAALLSFGRDAGAADVVDPDSFDPDRNPYRYPAATTATAGSKAAWAARMLGIAGWDTKSHDLTVAEWVQGRRDPGFDGILISSVDRVDARADVADALARTTLSIGVAGLAFHVQREHPADDAACPYCEYLSVGTPMSQLAVYAEQTGIPMPRAAELLAGARLEQCDVDHAVDAGRIRAEGSAAMVGRRFEDLVRRAYAQATITTSAGGIIAVSAPSVSWLAGTIVAAEIRKAEKSLPLLDRRIDIDLSGVPTGVVRRIARNRSGRCLCANPFRVRAARALYGT